MDKISFIRWFKYFTLFCVICYAIAVLFTGKFVISKMADNEKEILLFFFLLSAVIGLFPPPNEQ